MARNEANDMMIVATPNKSKLAENSCCTESSSVARLSPLSSLSSNEVRLLSKLKIVDQHRARQYDANGDIIKNNVSFFDRRWSKDSQFFTIKVINFSSLHDD